MCEKAGVVGGDIALRSLPPIGLGCELQPVNLTDGLKIFSVTIEKNKIKKNVNDGKCNETSDKVFLIQVGGVIIAVKVLAANQVLRQSQGTLMLTRLSTVLAG